MTCLLAWDYPRCTLFLGKCGIFVLTLWNIWNNYLSKCYFASILFHRLYFSFNTTCFITTMEVTIRSYIWNNMIWTIAIIFLKYKFQIHHWSNKKYKSWHYLLVYLLPSLELWRGIGRATRGQPQHNSWLWMRYLQWEDL